MKSAAAIYVYLCILLLLCGRGKAFKLNFIENFFVLHRINNIVIVDCDSDYKLVMMIKHLSACGFQVNAHRVSKSINKFDTLFRRDHHNVGIVVNLDCEDSAHFINRTSKVFEHPSIFNSTHTWLLLESKLKNDTFELLPLLNINIDAEITYVDMHNTHLYKLYDVYNTGRYHGGRLVVEYLGYWTTGGGFSLLPRKYKYVQRSNMTGVILQCMIVVKNKINTSLIEYLTNPIDAHNLDASSRFNYALLLNLKDMYNFSYNVTRAFKWGYVHNGTFNGMVGQLQQRNVDIGGSPVYFKLDRSKVVDYIIQSWSGKSRFIFRHPWQTSIFKIYTRPLNFEVWCCTLATILLASLTIYIIFKIQCRLKFSADEGSPSKVLLFTFGALFQQGINSNLPMLSAKLVIFTIFVFSILLYQFYSTSIVSSLLTNFPKTIKTLEHLVDSNLNAGIENILYDRDYFLRTKDEFALNLYKKKISNAKVHNLLSPAEGLKMVKNGGFAFHVDCATAYKIIADTFSEREICELCEIDLYSAPKPMIVAQKHSPLTKLMKYSLLKIIEIGLKEKQLSIWYAKKPKCVQSADLPYYQISIEEFSTVLIFLLIGIVLSIFIFFIEIAHAKFTYYMMRTLSWGYMQNGTFDGMVGQLERRNIDIGGSPIFFRLERAKVVDYTIQTWISRQCFIFRHPRQTSIFEIYIRPLNTGVWCCALATILIASVTVYVLFKIQNKLKTFANEGSLSEVLLLTFGALFQQGMTGNLPMLSGKVVIITLFTFSLLLYQFYSASIVSSLLMDPPKTIKTLKNLIDSNLKAGIEDIAYTLDYFRRTNDEFALNLYKKKIFNAKVHNLLTPDEGLKLVKNGGFAFHVDTATAYKIITDTFSEQEVCELSEINLFPEQKMMAIVQKHSPFRKLVTYGLRKIAERGLMARQRTLWHAKKPKCVNSADPSKFKVTIKEFSSVLIFLIVGMTLSVCILLVEIVYAKFT